MGAEGSLHDIDDVGRGLSDRHKDMAVLPPAKRSMKLPVNEPRRGNFLDLQDPAQAEGPRA
jgi:hypothetical protein